MTRSVRDAVAAARGARRPARSRSPRRPLRALRASPCRRTLVLDGLDPTVAARLRARACGARAPPARGSTTIALPPLGRDRVDQRQRRLRGGRELGLAPRAGSAERGADYDPRVALRIRRGETMSAADYIDLLARAARLDRAHGQRRSQAFDALLSPDRADRRAADRAAASPSDEAFFAANGLLLRNPSIVNLLDGCALSAALPRATASCRSA